MKQKYETSGFTITYYQWLYYHIISLSKEFGSMGHTWSLRAITTQIKVNT